MILIANKYYISIKKFQNLPLYLPIVIIIKIVVIKHQISKKIIILTSKQI